LIYNVFDCLIGVINDECVASALERAIIQWVAVTLWTSGVFLRFAYKSSVVRTLLFYIRLCVHLFCC